MKIMKEDDEYCCGCGNCKGMNCHCNCADNRNASVGSVQTITFTTKSGQTLGCCTDENIVSIKIESSNGNVSIFNLQ